jgi:hypothetical protein
MNQLEQTRHSLARIRQRGLRETDAYLILELGTEFRSGVFMLTNQDADALIAELSMFADPQDRTGHGMSAGELKRPIDGLRGATVVARGWTVITAFHKTAPHMRTDPRYRRRCQRRGAESRRRSFHFGAHWRSDPANRAPLLSDRRRWPSGTRAIRPLAGPKGPGLPP